MDIKKAREILERMLSEIESSDMRFKELAEQSDAIRTVLTELGDMEAMLAEATMISFRDEELWRCGDLDWTSYDTGFYPTALAAYRSIREGDKG